MVAEMRNWVADNRNSERPPQYFLQRLYDFDAMLVLMPSREQPGAYVLGRRKQWGPGITESAIDAVYSKPDTKMAIINGTVPVCMVFKPVNGSWNPDPLIRTLMARDIWAHGGADAVADMLEAQEDAEKAAALEVSRKNIWDRSGDAWRSYQARTGQSTIRFHDFLPTRHSASSPGAGVPVSNPDSSSTAGLGKLRNQRKRLRKKRNATIGRRGQ
jgi:hypothetical protein